jgi:hypothetical protein
LVFTDPNEIEDQSKFDVVFFSRVFIGFQAIHLIILHEELSYGSSMFFTSLSSINKNNPIIFSD